jgi:hypothetical protein
MKSDTLSLELGENNTGTIKSAIGHCFESVAFICLLLCYSVYYRNICVIDTPVSVDMGQWPCVFVHNFRNFGGVYSFFLFKVPWSWRQKLSRNVYRKLEPLSARLCWLQVSVILASPLARRHLKRGCLTKIVYIFLICLYINCVNPVKRNVCCMYGHI